jgi:hypothetical protein
VALRFVREMRRSVRPDAAIGHEGTAAPSLFRWIESCDVFVAERLLQRVVDVLNRVR